MSAMALARDACATAKSFARIKCGGPDGPSTKPPFLASPRRRPRRRPVGPTAQRVGAETARQPQDERTEQRALAAYAFWEISLDPGFLAGNPLRRGRCPTVD